MGFGERPFLIYAGNMIQSDKAHTVGGSRGIALASALINHF